MKLPIVCLLSILAFVTAQVEEAFVDYETRFLADRVVTLSELQTHATIANGLWTALGGIVYDITNFVHPGGMTNLLKVGGIEGDALYLKAYNNKDHPFTLAAVVTRPGIVRIGPLNKNAPLYAGTMMNRTFFALVFAILCLSLNTLLVNANEQHDQLAMEGPEDASNGLVRKRVLKKKKKQKGFKCPTCLDLANCECVVDNGCCDAVAPICSNFCNITR